MTGLLSSIVAAPVLVKLFVESPFLAGVTLTAGVVMKAVTAWLNIGDTKRSFREIAFVHEVMGKIKEKV